jgi:hypothetical protein
MENNVTLVSAFIANANQRQDRSINDYISYGKKLMAAPINKIIFFDDSEIEKLPDECFNNNTLIIPIKKDDNYLYQYGNKSNKTYAAKFNWQTKTVNLITSQGTKTAEIEEGAQDLLSFMYQFMFLAPLERMQISIATGKKLTSYTYSFSGEENINTPLGEIKTIHIFHESENSDEKTELWLALDYEYLPVKIRKTEKKGRVYELVANRIRTTPPTSN